MCVLAKPQGMPLHLLICNPTGVANNKETAMPATQVTQTNWAQDADHLETQVKACQFMLGTTLSKELAYQLRHAVMQLDEANQMVISYAVTVRNLAKYTIENVQNNQRVLQTVGNASNDLAKMVEKRQTAVDTMQLLLTLALPVPEGADTHQADDIRTHRIELAKYVCERAANRTAQR